MQERRPEYAPGHFDCLRCNGIVRGVFDFSRLAIRFTGAVLGWRPATPPLAPNPPRWRAQSQQLAPGWIICIRLFEYAAFPSATACQGPRAADEQEVLGSEIQKVHGLGRQ